MAPKRSKRAVGTVVHVTKNVVQETVKIDVEMGGSEEQQKATEIVVVERGVNEVLPVVVHLTAKSKGKETENGEDTREENAGKKKMKMKRKKSGSSLGVTNGGYKRYVFKVLKQVHPGMSVSAMAMSVLEGMTCDMFERIAEAAAQLNKYTGKETLSYKEIQDAVRLVIPGELGKHAISEGVKAVTTYMEK